MKTVIFLALLTCIFLFTCVKNNNKISTARTYAFKFKGLLKKTNSSNNIYVWTHVISNNDKTYALRSSTIILDNYINQTITLREIKLKDTLLIGPEYIDVKEVR